MNYQCMGSKACPCCGYESECGEEFTVTMTKVCPATRDDPKEGGEITPTECMKCKTEVDREMIKQWYKDCGDHDDRDDRDDHDDREEPRTIVIRHLNAVIQEPLS